MCLHERIKSFIIQAMHSMCECSRISQNVFGFSFVFLLMKMINVVQCKQQAVANQFYKVKYIHFQVIFCSSSNSFDFFFYSFEQFNSIGMKKKYFIFNRSIAIISQTKLIWNDQFCSSFFHFFEFFFFGRTIANIFCVYCLMHRL